MSEVEDRNGLSQEGVETLIAAFEAPSREAPELHSVEPPADSFHETPAPPEEEHTPTVLAPVEATLLDKSSGPTAVPEPENEGVQPRTRTDSLTGLPNLTMLDSFLWLQVQQRLREELPGYLGVIMVDIDRLRRLNEMLGGGASDEIVRAFSVVLEHAARESDFLVRYGGGTFCLAVSHATPDSLALAGERLRAYIERHDLELGARGNWRVTASFGCAWLPDVRESGDPVVKLLEAADAQLHQARMHGGNCVAVAAESIVSPADAAGQLPAPDDRGDRVATPKDAVALIEALPDDDRAVWATAFFAGLRAGELAALRNEDVDLEAGVLRVERSWNRRVGVMKPKNRAGRRVVPIVAALHPHLAAHKLEPSGDEDLFFGEGERPFDRDALVDRAARAWEEAGLSPLGLGAARDAFASFLIAAGVNAKAISTYLGHSTIETTFDRYGHLMSGNEEQAVDLIDAYLQRTTTARWSGAPPIALQQAQPSD